WVVQRYANLPLTSKLVDALVLACSLALAILWQGDLRRLMELLGTGRLDVLFGSQGADKLASGAVAVLSEAAGKLSQLRRGGLIVLDLGSDLRPEDFLNPGIALDAQLSVDLILNLFTANTPLHDGALLVKGNRILSAGVILPISRQGLNRFGTRHLAALGITERFDRCLCIVVSEETGTLSLARQGRLERPITSGRLQELLADAMAQSAAKPGSKAASKPQAKGSAQASARGPAQGAGPTHGTAAARSGVGPGLATGPKSPVSTGRTVAQEGPDPHA
ncbi:MAG: diadenylate cyclase, partial [Cyanobacteria bacterium]|nr:diadenylate cyclase [Cyanobacteriota bacterium]